MEPHDSVLRCIVCGLEIDGEGVSEAKPFCCLACANLEASMEMADRHFQQVVHLASSSQFERARELLGSTPSLLPELASTDWLRRESAKCLVYVADLQGSLQDVVAACDVLIRDSKIALADLALWYQYRAGALVSLGNSSEAIANYETAIDAASGEHPGSYLGILSDYLDLANRCGHSLPERYASLRGDLLRYYYGDAVPADLLHGSDCEQLQHVVSSLVAAHRRYFQVSVECRRLARMPETMRPACELLLSYISTEEVSALRSKAQTDLDSLRLQIPTDER